MFSAWYEFFPRSEGATYDEATGTVVSGTFRTAAERLDAVAAMGFDVVYLPPIHPIGEVNRKGPNNTLDPGPDDPGSPWAIGSKDGGHDAIHPDLGTLADFDAFVAQGRVGSGSRSRSTSPCRRARPSVGDRATPSGSPPAPTAPSPTPRTRPKKYQDIYPINFDNDPQGICREVLRDRPALDVATACGSSGSTTRTPSRVAFWEWLLARDPHVPTPTCSSWPRRSPGRR